jgi:chromosome segregation ATPase
MPFVNMNRGPAVDVEEARLAQLEDRLAPMLRQHDALMRQASEADAVCKRAAAEAAALKQSIAELELRRDEQAALVAQRNHHLQTAAQRELLERQAARLASEVQVAETELAHKRAAHAAIMTKLAPQSTL